MAVQLTPAQEERLQQLAAQNALTPEELIQREFDRFLDREEGFATCSEAGRRGHCRRQSA